MTPARGAAPCSGSGASPRARPFYPAQVTTCEVKREPDGRSRGFGFINFESLTDSAFDEFTNGRHELARASPSGLPAGRPPPA